MANWYIVDDAFESVFEGNEVEESEIMDKIYDEIGIDFTSQVFSPQKLVYL